MKKEKNIRFKTVNKYSSNYKILLLKQPNYLVLPPYKCLEIVCFAFYLVAIYINLLQRKTPIS